MQVNETFKDPVKCLGNTADAGKQFTSSGGGQTNL